MHFSLSVQYTYKEVVKAQREAVRWLHPEAERCAAILHTNPKEKKVRERTLIENSWLICNSKYMHKLHEERVLCVLNSGFVYFHLSTEATSFVESWKLFIIWLNIGGFREKILFAMITFHYKTRTTCAYIGYLLIFTLVYAHNMYLFIL